MKPTTDAPTTTEPTMRPTNKPTMKPTKEVSSKFHMSWFLTQQYTLCVGMDMNFISLGTHFIYYTQQPIFNNDTLPCLLSCATTYTNHTIYNTSLVYKTKMNVSRGNDDSLSYNLQHDVVYNFWITICQMMINHYTTIMLAHFPLSNLRRLKHPHGTLYCHHHLLYSHQKVQVILHRLSLRCPRLVRYVAWCCTWCYELG